MLRREVERLRLENERLRSALVWCGGSADFAPRGRARRGWLRMVAPLIVGRLSAHWGRRARRWWPE